MLNRRMMNYFAAVSIIAMALACTTKKHDHHGDEHHDDTALDEWVEMDSFHFVMAESFHPFMDSGNIAPARANAAHMEALASKWADAALPEKVDNDEMRTKLHKLHTSTSNFRTIAQGSDEKAVGDSLTKLHDAFHAIMDAWYHQEAH